MNRTVVCELTREYSTDQKQSQNLVTHRQGQIKSNMGPGLLRIDGPLGSVPTSCLWYTLTNLPKYCMVPKHATLCHTCIFYPSSSFGKKKKYTTLFNYFSLWNPWKSLVNVSHSETATKKVFAQVN